jgi:hypothetical protein
LFLNGDLGYAREACSMVERLELFSTPKSSEKKRPEAERARGTFLSWARGSESDPVLFHH